jgi:hypothetical protein
MMLSLFALLRRVAQTPGGLNIDVISEHEGTLAVDLAELERNGLISTSRSTSPRTDSLELTATVTDLGRAALRASPAPIPDSPRS